MTDDIISEYTTSIEKVENGKSCCINIEYSLMYNDGTDENQALAELTTQLLESFKDATQMLMEQKRSFKEM